MRRAGLVLLGFALLLVLGRIGLGLVRPPDDARLIREAIAEAAKASREGRPGGVLDALSSEASLNGQTAESPRQIADVVRRLQPDLQIASIEPTITGDEARVVSPAKLTLGLLGAKRTYDVARLTVVLGREDDRDLLVIPTHRWRVRRVEVPEDVLGGLLAGAAFGG